MRTMGQWDDSVNAGFTTAKPWLRLDDDYRLRNVSSLEREPRSILTLYKGLIALRR